MARYYAKKLHRHLYNTYRTPPMLRWTTKLESLLWMDFPFGSLNQLLALAQLRSYLRASRASRSFFTAGGSGNDREWLSEAMRLREESLDRDSQRSTSRVLGAQEPERQMSEWQWDEADRTF
jgi:hypothetical protein